MIMMTIVTVTSTVINDDHDLNANGEMIMMIMIDYGNEVGD